MNLVNISTGDLEAVLAVSRTQSFRAAADELHLTQSAISARVQHAEDVLGVKLFSRTTRRVGLTSHGERLCTIADRTLADLRSLVKEFKEESQLTRGKVAFGAVLTVACSFVPEVVRSFQQRRPGIKVRLRDDFLGTSFNRIVDGELDFALSTVPLINAQLDFELLLLDEICLLARLDHPFATADTVSLKSISQYPVLVQPGLHMLDRTLLEAFEREGLTLRRDELCSALHPQSIASLVRAGLGLCFMPATILSELNMSSLRALRVGDAGLYRRIGIVTAHGRPVQPAPQALIEEFRAAANSLGMQVSRPAGDVRAFGQPPGTLAVSLRRLA